MQNYLTVGQTQDLLYWNSLCDVLDDASCDESCHKFQSWECDFLQRCHSVLCEYNG
ncbi:hypothetical protein DPMN_127438 [Dreissena polymorpha]|uniref:Uncharacterized protein n=1 Tax=Dreissena polymorpha TaxID=45954 RepID=A0A9D4JZ55_DREPO|nr:hypothetical protein DPMN_127438 [Dreissena polymorpha]